MIVFKLDGGLLPDKVCALSAEDLDMPKEGSWATSVRRAINRKGEVIAVKDDEARLVYPTDDALEAIAQNIKGLRKGFIF